jgi:hypothetical protein
MLNSAILLGDVFENIKETGTVSMYSDIRRENENGMKLKKKQLFFEKQKYLQFMHPANS